MGGVRLVYDDDADVKILAAWDAFGEDHLGPEIADRAKRYAPKRTGALAGSVENHMNGHTIVVKASGSDERDYAAYVELGHRVFHPSTRIAGPEVVPPEPFLRPALFSDFTAPTVLHRLTPGDMVWRWQSQRGMGSHLQTKRMGYTYLGQLGGMYVYERNGQRIYSMESPRSGGPSGRLVRGATSQHEAYRRKVLREHGIDVDDPGETRIPF